MTGKEATGSAARSSPVDIRCASEPRVAISRAAERPRRLPPFRTLSRAVRVTHRVLTFEREAVCDVLA